MHHNVPKRFVHVLWIVNIFESRTAPLVAFSYERNILFGYVYYLWNLSIMIWRNAMWMQFPNGHIFLHPRSLAALPTQYCSTWLLAMLWQHFRDIHVCFKIESKKLSSNAFSNMTDYAVSWVNLAYSMYQVQRDKLWSFSMGIRYDMLRNSVGCESSVSGTGLNKPQCNIELCIWYSFITQLCR